MDQSVFYIVNLKHDLLLLSLSLSMFCLQCYSSSFVIPQCYHQELSLETSLLETVLVYETLVTAWKTYYENLSLIFSDSFSYDMWIMVLPDQFDAIDARLT